MTQPPLSVTPIVPAPEQPEAWPAWRKSLHQWRQTARDEIHYDDELYRAPEFTWISSCFTCGFVMMCDETFYDPSAGEYRVDAFLDAGVQEFGGYDAVVLWHAYPNIGFDERNQYDFYRDMPGSLPDVRRIIDQCHSRNVRVFIAYNPWDTGTRREPKADREVLADFVHELNADGIFLDTMRHGGPELRAALDVARPGVVLESENDLPIEYIHDHHMSWAQWFQDSPVPGVLRNKWLEQRHMQHQIRRWNLDHSDELHTAWINGAGMLVWENVFGSWVGWNKRDKAFLRSMLPVLRRYADLIAGGTWTPLAHTLQDGVYANNWEGGDIRLWTLVNRTHDLKTGSLVAAPVQPGWCYFDLITGKEALTSVVEDHVELPGTLPARGLGAFVALPVAAVDEGFLSFLAGQAERRMHWTEDTSFPELTLQRQSVGATALAVAVPPRMVSVEGGVTNQTCVYRNRECGFLTFPFVGQQWPLPNFHATVEEEYKVNIGRLAVDESEVTNRQYAEFLGATGYTPRFATNFLKHWIDGAPAEGTDSEPVVYVDLDDARAYASWVGKRLPTEAEWQYALATSAARRGTPRVWNWTESVHSDGRTRFCLLKGGTDYRAEGSDWYADGGPRDPQYTAKFLLLWPGLDRCRTIGFRCVVDLRA